MKKLLAALLMLLLTACAAPKPELSSAYEADFKTVFQASLSALKDHKFTIKNMDFNSGEIDAYLRYQDGDRQKEIRTTVALEQSGKSVKVRMHNAKAEDSAFISSGELSATEAKFFNSLNKALSVGAKN